MRNNIGLILLGTLMLFSLSVFAQRQKIMVHASGMAVGTNMETVKAEALYKAKKNALLNAGFKETISSFSTVHIGETTESTGILSDELSIIELDGRVILKKEPAYFQELIDEQIRCTAKIEAEVILDEKKSDPEFTCRVSGFNTVYRNGDPITFSVQPSQDGYLRVFWFDSSPKSSKSGDLIYPHPEFFREVKLRKEMKYVFPPTSDAFNLNGEIDITAEKLYDSPVESNLLLVVLLKRPIQFPDEVNYQNVYRWLLNIPANERYYKWIKFDITK